MGHERVYINVLYGCKSDCLNKEEKEEKEMRKGSE
jgi:hypothetical protein